MSDKVIRDIRRRIELNEPLREVNIGQIVRGDANADRFVLELVENGQPVNLDDYSVSGFFVNAIGLDVPITGDITGNVLTATLSKGCYDVRGMAGGFIRVANGDATVIKTVLRFTTDVLSDGTGNIYDPDKVIGSVAELLAKIAAMEKATADGLAAAEEARSAAAEADAAREAIQGDLGALKDQMSDTPLSEVSAAFEIIRNSQVTSSTGIISEKTGHSRSDYIDLMSASQIQFNVTVVNVCFYDGDKNYVSGVVSPGPAARDIPGAAKFAIFTEISADIDTVEVTLKNVPTALSKVYDALGKKVSSAKLPEFDLESDVVLQNVYGVTKFPNNLVDAGECVNNSFVQYNNGSLAADNNYFCTGYIPVTGDTTYKSNLGRNHAWYDVTKAYISGMSGKDIQSGIIAPSDAAYIRFTINKTTDGTSNPYDVYFTSVDFYDATVRIPDLHMDSVAPWCHGKRINWIGDSIVAGSNFDEVVCSALGLVKANEYGINGSTIALKANGEDDRNALCIRYANMSDDADIIAVSCGTNDFKYAWCPIGTIESTENTTFYGALKTLCEGLINKYPQKLIFFTTPIKRAQAFENGNGGEYTADGVMTTPFSKNKYGKTLGDYADIIKEVCGYYSIPVLDMYRESLLNPHILSQQNMFDSVLTHPNSTGQKVMARRICGWLTQLGYTIEGLS